MISKNFIKNSTIYTVAGAMPMASAVILLPFYQHYLSVELFGSLSVFLAFSILVQIVVTFSFDSSIYLHFHDFKSEPKKLNHFISSAFLFVLIISLGVSIILVSGGTLLFNWMSDGKIDFYPFGPLAIVTAVFQAVLKINNSLLQSQQKPISFFWINVVNFLLTVCFTALGLVYYAGTLVGPIGGRMLAFAFTGGFVLASVLKTYGASFNFQLLRSTFSYNFYQFIYQLQQWIINYADRFILILVVSAADLGVYDFALKCLLLLDFTIAGLYNSFFPKILSINSTTEIKGSSVETNRYFHGLTAAILLMISGTIFVLPILIEWFVSKPGYVYSAELIPYLALIYLPRALKLYYAMPYNLMKHSKPLPLLFLIVSMLKLALSFLLIRRFGILGAGLATFLCQLVEIKLLHSWIAKKYQFKMNWVKMFLVPSLFFTLVVLIEPYAGGYRTWAHFVYLLFAGTLLVWTYRNELALLFTRRDTKSVT